MPIHDWTRVSAGTFHAFHNAWITHIQEALNNGLLPKSYYALGEQRSGDIGPDILALKTNGGPPDDAVRQATTSYELTSQLFSANASPPQVQLTAEADEDADFVLKKLRRVVVRQSSGDRMVAIIEIVSPGNRKSNATMDDFADKVIACLKNSVHVVVLDLFPANQSQPGGIHGVIWDRLAGEPFASPAENPLTMVSYTARQPVKAWIEPCQVGDKLAAMPLFLTDEYYLPLPLEVTYAQSWKGVPERWRDVIEDHQTSA